MLVGHSLGGYAALRLAETFAGRTKQVVLIAGHLFKANEILSGDIKWYSDLKATLTLCRAIASACTPIQGPFRKALNESRRVRKVVLPPIIDPFPITNETRVGDCLSAQGPLPTYHDIRFGRVASLREAARSCDSPVRLLAGEFDPLTGEYDMGVARELFKSLEVITLRSCAHWPIVERPDLVVRHLAEDLVHGC